MTQMRVRVQPAQIRLHLIDMQFAMQYLHCGESNSLKG
jgi:hypothetical protein